MFRFEGLKLDEDLQPLNLECGEKEQVVLSMPGKGPVQNLLSLLRNGQPPEGRIVRKGNRAIGFWQEKEEDWGDWSVGKVLTGHVEQLLIALRKYEKISMKMAKHFSPARLSGYMEEMEELEAFINDHKAWELEHEIRDWRAFLNLPDSETPMRSLSRTDRKKAELAALLMAPGLFRVMENPFSYLNTQETDAVIKKLQYSETGWLLLAASDDPLPFDNFDRKLELA